VINRAKDNEYVRRAKGWRTGAAFTLWAKMPHCICDSSGLRTITPGECEALMGFPKGWTDVEFNGRRPGNHARTFALGNSWPVNCARFVCERIDKYVRGVLP
jgi:DNA (cytosine-5)-methyltransferase 1